MSSLPKVSIIIPNYNYERYIVNVVDSCLQQDYKGEIEIIVIDDCSTDNSVAVINKCFGNKIKLITKKINEGYSKAKNEGIVQSTGDLITAIDADDLLTIDSISKRVEVFIAHPQIQLVHAQAYTVLGDGDYLYWFKRLRKLHVSSRQDKIHAQTVMVRRGVHISYGLYDESLRSRSDNEMWNRLRDVAKIELYFYFLMHPVAFYRKHNLSMIEYRKRNPAYNTEITSKLEAQKALRIKEGITPTNTRMLLK